MDPRIPNRRLNERGLSSVQFVLASGLALIFFVALANIVVVQYAKGSMRSALDQGVRAGAVTGSVVDCERRVAEVFNSLLSGSIGDTIAYECRVEGVLMTATASLTVDSWTPFTADFDVELEATATREPDV